ncbi:flavonol synthase/flavanone 3-hydroxylase [Selaginella moellendorffii]|uniref:flavonol synthase/flavanone 3-hydroxylase n=1 Tax=Selaginella moellendorffii TaxID=88036 RepID=UPI000D1CE6E1|nr:flavonol synthase/flavanone 3-hydroxylase [Selaginella moellendorffii]|eukprot:XP_024534793.1 flavonol synthase/flavanone 3-hydroxylase [Selaginella moellendorffii]
MTPSQETHMEWRLASSYVSSVRHLSQTLMSALSEGLGLDSNCLAKSFGDSEMILRSNYYPPCPNPDLALGMNGHTDSGGLTILFEDQVGGLQARKGDLWYDLKPIKNAFIVNIADQLELEDDALEVLAIANHAVDLQDLSRNRKDGLLSA